VKTDRYLGHFQGDPETYRPAGEVAELRKSDPIVRLAAQLREQRLLDDAREQAIRQRVSARINEAYDYARSSPYPKPEDALRHVFN
jgi:TPP-dependent pyruvate/acetoin dehydrogenase alpha subunit